MTLQTCLSGLVIMSFVSGFKLECVQKNTSCSDMKTAEGFRFLHQCPTGSELSVIDNKTKIAYAKFGTQEIKYSDKVMSLDNQSVVTKECRDLHIMCHVPNGLFRGESGVKDVCVDYRITNITEELENADPSDSPSPRTINGASVGVIVGVIVGVSVVLLVLCGIFGLCYICWKRRQHDEATVSGYLRYLRTRCCLRNKSSENGEAPESGHHDGQDVQQVLTDDVDTTHPNGDIRMSEIEPASVGEDNTDNTLGSVIVQGTDPTANGLTLPSLSQAYILKNNGIQPTENGDISGTNVNRASNHPAVNRSSEHDPVRDPGGVNDNKAKGSARIGEKLNGWTHGDRGPDDGSDEGQLLMIEEKLSGRTLIDRGPDDGNDENQPLMPDQRAANQDSDMTGGAVALVDKHGPDPDPVSRCSTAPDTGVESTPT